MKHWIEAMRLRTLPLALASIAMGSFLAASHGHFDPIIFVLCLLTTFGLQILSNLANDYGDAVHGADNVEREGPSRQVQQGSISRNSMKRAIVIAAIITLGLGLSLLWMADLPPRVYLLFVGLGLLAILAAVLYTNGVRPYGYVGLGDISVFLFFGLLGVIGTYYLMSQDFNPLLLLPGSACGLLTVSVLNVNNIRDIESDLKAGKYSIPVRLGRDKAVVYHILLLVASMVCAVSYVLLQYTGPLQFLFFLVFPFLFINIQAVRKKTLAQDLDPYLKQMAMTTLMFVIFFGIGNLL